MLVIQRIRGQELRMLVLLPLYLAGPGLGLGWAWGPVTQGEGGEFRGSCESWG